MLARLHTAVLVGLTAHPVGVEVDIGRGLPAISIIGLGDTAVLQARDRIRAAFGNSGFDWPDRRITVSLSPSDLPKHGAGFDLPIAIGLLTAAGHTPTTATGGLWAVGELGLDGAVRPVRGVLSVALAARDAGADLLLVPTANLAEAALVSGLRVAAAGSLRQVGGWLGGTDVLDTPPAGATPTVTLPTAAEDLAEVCGQVTARRGLEVAAAGGHNLLLVGPPGSGKTMLARRLPGILPPLTDDEALTVTQIHSAAGLLGPATPLVASRPFRTPHHTTSVAGLIGGGGGIPRPGEISLAHHGVLFLDELAEFPRIALEALRQPLEDGHVTVVRATAAIRYPARFALVGAANPCPCGHAGDPTRRCRCTPDLRHRYERKLSGPLLDRVDVFVTVDRVSPAQLDPVRPAEPSAAVRARVLAARARQADRGHLNAHLPAAGLLAACRPTPAARQMLVTATERLGLTARAYHRALRVARTVADLDTHDTITTDHMAQALNLRHSQHPTGGTSAAS